MNNDENSFLSGVIVGRQLRGWGHAKRLVSVSPWSEKTPAEHNDPNHGTITWDSTHVSVETPVGETDVLPKYYMEAYIKKLVDLSGWRSIGVGPNAPYGDGSFGEMFSTNIDGVTVEIFNSNYSLNIIGYLNGQKIYSSHSIGWLSYNERYMAHVAYYSGLDWEEFQFLAPAFNNYGSSCGMMTILVTDYFRPDRKIAFIGREGGKFGQPLEGSFNSRFATLNSGGTPASSGFKIIRPYNAIHNSLIEVAAPINIYSGAQIYDGIHGISGFVGGMNNLYNITKGSDIRDTGDVNNRLSVGGVEFAGGGGTSGHAIRIG